MNDERLEELMAEFWSRRDAGESLSTAEFLKEHPEHAVALRPALVAMLGASAMLPAADLPSHIAGYEVKGRLGRGATGEVFLVVDAHGRQLALKRLLPHVGAVVRAQQRLQREAAVLRGLRHRNIVEVVDVGEDAAAGGTPFVVMERIDGSTLLAVITAAREQGREVAFARFLGPGDSWQRVARLMAALADALAAAHAAGVLHRDLKPGNVLLRADGTPVVVDFGLAADAGAATLTGTGDVLGTPHYMAPEQARGLTASAACDVYGLGAILHELLTLTPPRHGGDALQVLVAARTELPLSPRRVSREVPRELDLITRRAMAFRPGMRYANAGELAHALQLVADGGRPIGLTLGWPLRVEEFYRRRKSVLVGLLVAAVLAVVVWIGMDLRQAARADRLRAAMVDAAECHFDDDARGVEAAADVLDGEGEATLASWLRLGDDVATADPFVQALATGHRALAKDARGAMASFQRAVELRPDSPIPVAWLGIAAVRAKADVVAERELTSAVRSLPNCVRLRFELSRVLRQQKKTAVALTHMQHAVTLPRANAETWHELAKALSADQQQELALAAVEKAIAMSPGKSSLNILRTKSLILDRLKRYEEALPLLRSILDESPSKEAWMSYGGTLDYLHKFHEAAAAYRAALAIDKKHATALLYLAHLYSGSDGANCAKCKAFFEANPEMVDPALVDEYATALLGAQEGGFELAETVAEYVRRVGGGERFLAAIEERLRKDLPAEALGKLLRARKVLRPE